MKNTALHSLSKALCNLQTKFFSNQAEMFQILIKFSCAELNETYGTSNTDILVYDIRNYLCDLNKIYFDSENEYNYEILNKYLQLHNCITDNINQEKGNNSLTSVPGNNQNHIVIDQNTRTNINKTISSERPLPNAWIKEYQKSKLDKNIMFYRIFWILQYYFVYFSNNTHSVNKNRILRNDLMYTEFFSMEYKYKENLLNQLKAECSKYSSILKWCSVTHFDFLVFAKIIYDILSAHYELHNYSKISLKEHKINYFSAEPKIRSYDIQFDEYVSHIDAYGEKTYDRLKILERYAKTNFIAANELGNIYFFGEHFIFGGNNEYVVKPNYKKACEYYEYAIINSNPPYPIACWSLGQILSSAMYSEHNFSKAIEYFKLAGDHPASLSSLANIMISSLDESYITSTYSSYTELILNYTEALEKAYKASNLDWVYGNNIIASFIDRHKKHEQLLKDIKKIISFSENFDYEKMLLRSCNSNNPWALNTLAKYYIATNQKPKAEPLLKRACEVKYNQALYTYAHNFCDNTDDKLNYLKESSDLGFSIATYELAKINISSPEIAINYILKAEYQNLTLVHSNISLQDKITALKNTLLNSK